MRKGIAIAGLILGIASAAVSACAIVFSAIALGGSARAAARRRV